MALGRDPSSADAAIVTPRRAMAVSSAVYALFIALHLFIAQDAGAVVRGIVPGIGGWLGPAGWAIYAVVAAAAVALVGIAATGLTRAPAPGSWRLTTGPIVAGLPFLLLGVNIAPGDVLPLLVVGVPLVALNEELFYRGVLLPLLRPLGWRRAIVWSSIAFGASHLANLASGAYPPFVAMQVAATTAGGVALAAIRIRSGSLWPVLATHAVLDVVAVSTLTGPGTSSPILVPVLLAWVGANLCLWRYGMRLVSGLSDEELDLQFENGARPRWARAAHISVRT
jgi:membrane protease YdiL (CAAX protease family)